MFEIKNLQEVVEKEEQCKVVEKKIGTIENFQPTTSFGQVDPSGKGSLVSNKFDYLSNLHLLMKDPSQMLSLCLPM